LHPEAPLLFELYLYLYPLTYFCAGSLYHFIIKENFFDPVSFFIFLFSTIILSFFSLFFKPKNVVAVCSYFSIIEFMFSLYFFPYFFKIVPIFGFQNLDINFFFFDVFSYSLLVLTLFVYILLFFFYRFSLSLKNIKSFLFILLFSKYILVFIFLTTKIFYFFIFFETILLPFFFLISLWGSNLNRIWSAQRLLFFTLFFSTPFFYFILQHINFVTSTFFDFSNFFFLTEFSINFFSMFIFFVSVFLFLGVKIPLFPMHI
jgi:NADH:ubiquinone oxidoreductase subunit 4 (subunit M)